MVTKLTKHVNQRDIYERRRILEPSQKILLYDVLATNLRGLLFEPPQNFWKDFYNQRVRNFTTTFAFKPPTKNDIGLSGKREPRFFSKGVIETKFDDSGVAKIFENAEPIKKSGTKPDLTVRVSNLDAAKVAIANGAAVINIEEIAADAATPSQEELLARISDLIDTDPYCIINTSGSTGTPKGVVLNHKSFIDFMAQTFDEYRFSENDIIGSLSPVVFDIWSYEMCLLQGKGACIVVIPDTWSAFPVKILQWMQQQNVSYIFWVPTIMVNIANMDLLSTFKLESLRTVWFAGEVFPTKQYNYWHHHLPQTTFANLYGPIEITLDCTYYIVDKEIPDEQPLPIGYPCRNTDILVLDDEDRLVKEPGVEGELCVRGTSLAMGYYNNPEKTAAAFVQNPLNKAYPELIYRTGDIVCYNEDGLIMFKGRKDNIVKHMGYRTDLGEIEHVIINTLKLVKNGCIVYNQAEKQITLFYEAEQEIPVGEFRLQIGKVLPKYMIPTAFQRLEQLQRNANGKIDRLFYKKLVN